MRPTPTKAEVRLNKVQENKRDNKQAIEKQHADNQPEQDRRHRWKRRGRNSKGKK